MGMLDDAIREHLDLKRRQGADPTEIAQLETEALGGEKDSEPEVEAEVDLVEAEEIVADEPSESDTAEPEQDLLIEEEVVIEEVAVVEPDESQPTERFTPAEVEAAIEADQPAPEPALETEPELFEAEVAPEAAESASEEARDELEETPDFLEETPEHDRLWFERKPPRDFDF